MKVLVTGANGYIGSKVVNSLLEYKNIEVICVDIDSSHIDKRASFIKFDICRKFIYFCSNELYGQVRYDFNKTINIYSRKNDKKFC